VLLGYRPMICTAAADGAVEPKSRGVFEHRLPDHAVSPAGARAAANAFKERHGAARIECGGGAIMPDLFDRLRLRRGEISRRALL
jgi:hypothetical protein